MPQAHVPRFDVQRFIDDCVAASAAGGDPQSSVREVLARAIANPAAVLRGVGEPTRGGLRALYRSQSLTILNIVWSPLMQLLPHEHRMWSLVGIYTGREDNIFWRRDGARVAAVGAADISPGTAVALRADAIHSVANPIPRLTGALHVYGGDFFGVRRSEWDPETLTEREWSVAQAVRTFEESNDRFFAPGKPERGTTNPDG